MRLRPGTVDRVSTRNEGVGVSAVTVPATWDPPSTPVFRHLSLTSPEPQYLGDRPHRTALSSLLSTARRHAGPETEGYTHPCPTASPGSVRSIYLEDEHCLTQYLSKRGDAIPAYAPSADGHSGGAGGHGWDC